MPYVKNFDDPWTLYKLRPDGESADTVTVMGKEAYDEYMDPKPNGKHYPKEGWMDACPKLRYPLALYRLIGDGPYGDKMTVENRKEEEAALKAGWQHAPIAAKPEPLEAWQQEELESQNRRKQHQIAGMGQGTVPTASAGSSESDNSLRIRELEALVRSLLADKQAPAAAPKKRGRPFRKSVVKQPETVEVA